MAIIGIVAIAEDGAIGKDGRLPWHYPADLKYFKQKTTGQTVVMGNTTFESIGRPLPNRTNIVLTHKDKINVPGIITIHGKKELLKIAKKSKEDIYIIGGAKTYEYFSELIEKWLVTEIPVTVKNADAYISKNLWSELKLRCTTELDDGLIVKEYEKEPDGPSALYKPLMFLPTSNLLARFSSGNPIPGSGSAAAFSGIFACRLCLSVIRYTETKPDYEDTRSKFDFIENQLDRLESELRAAFQRDSVIFSEVISLRKKRDFASSPVEKRKFSAEELKKMRIATEIPLRVSKICHEIFNYSIVLFDEGYKSARGEAGAAASSALSGAHAALFTCFLNLKRFSDSKWKRKIHSECTSLLNFTNELQNELFSRVLRLKDEGKILDALQMELALKSDNESSINE